MRFEVSRVMDTIEQRLTTDVSLAQAVVDLGDVARHVDLDGGRGVNLIRIGMVVDALGRYLRDGGAMLYPVAGRDLLADPELTSKERMVLGRWADDGLIEVIPQVGDRVLEVADYAGLLLVGRDGYPDQVDRYPWLKDEPHRVLTVSPRGGGALLTDDAGSTGGVVVPGARSDDEAGVVPRPPSALETHAPSPIGAALLARSWRCPQELCPSFGPDRRIGQPVPRVRGSVAHCPRHDEPLADAGERPTAVPLSVVVDGMGRRRFRVTAERAVHVGRSPEHEDDVAIGGWLHGNASSWVSRDHLRLELADGELVVTDVSTNGTTVLGRPGPEGPSERIRLVRGEPRPLGEWDVVELYTGVVLARADRPAGTPGGDTEPTSVLVDAPTVALRLPGFGS